MTAHDVPDLAYGDAPDAFDSPDGRTYSEPATAQTPGRPARDRAEFIEWFVAQGHVIGCVPEDDMSDAFHAGMMSARTIAAQERPASGGCDCGESPCVRQDAPGSTWNEAGQLLIASQPQPAPELAAALRETRTVLGYLDDFTRAVIDLDARGAIVKTAHAVREKAGLPPVDGK